MCSIAGATDKKEVEGMLQMMVHRSPDGWKTRSLEDFCIGMGRLAIIDTKNTEFPFENERYVLTFNGEIYNYLDLKKELQLLGHQFHSNTDTEVLLEAFSKWGKECLDKLNGMFAFAIYDKKEHTIFFARDIAGEKPLYFREINFAFASEAKALNYDCVELKNAHCGVYDLKTNTLTTWRWWTFIPQEINLDTAETTLEKLLEDSVRLRTQTDVPYGLYLSEGIDSTLISTFHDFEETFTYVDGDFAEEFCFREVFPRIVWHLDYPIDSFSAYPLWKLAKQAHQNNVKVILSGEGADELFGGYIRYVGNGMNLAAQKKFPSYTSMFPYEGDLGRVDFEGKMQGLLRMGDRMASAWGIENRCPFLDRRIIEFAFSLPPELKCYGMDTKIILRRILAKRKPDYRDIEKKGLYSQVNKWLGVSDPFSKDVYLSKQQELWQKFQSS